MRRFIAAVCAANCLQWVCVPVFAAQNGGRVEEAYLLAVGGGVSAPSILDALSDNPAAMALNQRVKVQLTASAGSTSFNPLTGGVNLILGNGTLGGQIGLGLTVPGAMQPRIPAGFGFFIKPIKMAVGLTCEAALNGRVAISCPGVGLLINPEGAFRVGLELGLSALTFGGAFPVAAGVAIDLLKMFTLSVDAGTSIGGGAGGFNLIPGLGFRLGFFQASAAYGFSVLSSGGTRSGLVSGFTAGVGFSLGKRVHLSGHYNRTGLMWASFAASF